MPKRENKFCRTIADVALACGVKKLYAKSGMRNKQLESWKLWAEGGDSVDADSVPGNALSAEHQLPVFPKRESRGWTRVKVISAWDVARQRGWKVEKNQMVWERPVQNEKLKIKNGELADQEIGAPPDLFASPQEALEGRLDFLQKLYLTPNAFPERKIAKFEIDELRMHRPWIWVKKAKDSPASGASQSGGGPPHSKTLARDVTPMGIDIPEFEIGTQAGMAELIGKNFRMACSEQDISDWLRAKRVPRVDGQEAPPFPRPRARGGWADGREAFLWFERWIYEPAKRGSPQGALDLGTRAREAELRTKIHNENVARIESENAQRELDRKWVSRESARGAVLGAAAEWLRLTEGVIEKTGPLTRMERLRGQLSVVSGQLLAADVERLVAEFYAWDLEQARMAMDGIRARCGEAGKIKLTTDEHAA